ncbi:MAG TPA: hypothetical protein VKC66_01505 [Xanthobacteraceae bacterium]|nr:hypothetical protein [Xanthobacteraceae bacterium]
MVTAEFELTQDDYLEAQLGHYGRTLGKIFVPNRGRRDGLSDSETHQGVPAARSTVGFAALNSPYKIAM